MWALWRAHNALLFSKKGHTSDVVIDRAMEYLGAFHYAMQGATNRREIAREHPSKWKLPDIGWLKFNVNTSFSGSTVGFSFVLRNHVGEFLRLGAGLLHRIVNVEHAEIMAIWMSWTHI